MNQNSNNVATSSNDKSQWTSPDVWDLSVGKTQGGPFPAAVEGTPVSGTVEIDGNEFPFSSTGGPDPLGDINLGGAS